MFYRPDNAYLIVVGDFDQKQFDWTDKYFGRIAKPSTAIPTITAVKPAHYEERFAKTAPNVPFPAVAITYLGPRIIRDGIFQPCGSLKRSFQAVKAQGCTRHWFTSSR